MAGLNLQAFLTFLPIYESGSAPEMIFEYEMKYDLPEATTYWKMRTINGMNVLALTIMEVLSVFRYLTAIISTRL